MGDKLPDSRVTLLTLTVKTVVVHTVTYVVAGILAFAVMDYERTFSEPPLSYLMRPTSSTWVMAGPLFQPIRGVIFALAFYPLRRVLFAGRSGWLTMWWLLVALGILSTFGPALGSVEGIVYTIVPPLSQIVGLWETVLQSFLLAVILSHWVNHPEKRWLTLTLAVAFCIVIVLPALGLLARS